MTRRVLFLHYTPPGVIGGVEDVMHQHRSLLEWRGYTVECAAGRSAGAIGPVTVIPQIDAARPENALIEEELAAGVVSDDFRAAEAEIHRRLEPLFRSADSVIVHNAFTLHFSLPLTAALCRLAAVEPPGKIIAWCHDLAWTNPLYVPAMHEGFPWRLLRTRQPNVQYVTVSHERKDELCQLWGGACDEIDVIPNGVDPAGFLQLSAETRAIIAAHRLFERDVVLFLPVRITRRKNIEVGIRIVAALRDRGIDACYLVSGPRAPHHPGRSMSYLDELKSLRSQLGVEEQVVFLADELGGNLELRVVSELYSVADALLFTSGQEGFGLPILEAGIRRLPVVLSDIPIFREVAASDASFLDGNESADKMAEVVLRALDNNASRLYRRVLREYRWDAIVDRKIIPLLSRNEPTASGHVDAHS